MTEKLKIENQHLIGRSDPILRRPARPAHEAPRSTFQHFNISAFQLFSISAFQHLPPVPRPPRKFVPEPFDYHQEVDLRIDSLSNLGIGVGRIDDWIVFVPFCLPGEQVRARIYRNEKNCSHGDLIGVLEPSPDRTEPRCPLFGSIDSIAN